jgi:RNA recognition motif-containing protein
MKEKIHVSNLPSNTTDEDLMNLFVGVGSVSVAQVLHDVRRQDGGFCGLVEMDSNNDSQTAISTMNGSNFRGRRIVVEWATRRQANGGEQAPLFGPMNISDAPEDARAAGPARGGFGDRGGAGKMSGVFYVPMRFEAPVSGPQQRVEEKR